MRRIVITSREIPDELKVAHPELEFHAMSVEELAKLEAVLVQDPADLVPGYYGTSAVNEWIWGKAIYASSPIEEAARRILGVPQQNIWKPGDPTISSVLAANGDELYFLIDDLVPRFLVGEIQHRLLDDHINAMFVVEVGPISRLIGHYGSSQLRHVHSNHDKWLAAEWSATLRRICESDDDDSPFVASPHGITFG